MSEAYLDPNQKSTIKPSCDFCEEVLSQMFEWVVNTPLHIFSYSSVQARSQEFLRAGEVSANKGTNFWQF